MNFLAYQEEIVFILSVFTRFAISFYVIENLPREIIHLIILKYIDIHSNSLPIFHVFDQTLYMIYKKKMFFLRHETIGKGSSFSEYIKKLSLKDENYLHPYRFINSNMVYSFDIDNDVISISSSINHCLIVVKDGLYEVRDYSGHDPKNNDYIHCQKININNILTTSCGYNSSMILTKNGLFVKGLNGFGQLGLGDYYKRKSIELVKFNNNIITVSSGTFSTFIITKEGLYSTGLNDDGQLGLGDCSNSNIFKRVNIENIISIKCGGEYSLALTKDGLYGCGSNRDDQLGGWDFINQLFITKEKKINTFQKININITNLISYSCRQYESYLFTKEGLFKNFIKQNYSYLKCDDIILEQSVFDLILTKKELLWFGNNGDFDYACNHPDYKDSKIILINTLAFNK